MHVMLTHVEDQHKVVVAYDHLVYTGDRVLGPRKSFQKDLGIETEAMENVAEIRCLKRTKKRKTCAKEPCRERQAESADIAIVVDCKDRSLVTLVNPRVDLEVPEIAKSQNVFFLASNH